MKPASLRTLRTIMAAVLVIVGTICALAGVVYLWAGDTVYDSDHFAATAVEAARAPAVKTEISRVLVDQAVNAKPELISIRPLLETVVETIVSTPLFGRVLVLAVGDLHRGLLNSGGHSYALDLSNGLTVAIGRLRVVNPQVADQIPPDISAGLIKFGKGDLASELARGLEQLRALLLVLGVAGPLLLAAAVAISPARRTALAGIGISLTTAALLLFLALAVGREVLLRQIDVATTAAAAGSVFDTFTAELSARLWVFAIAGVVLASIASASLHAAGAQEALERARRAAAWAAATHWARLTALGAAAALGGALLLVPEAALSLVARAAGLAVLYLSGSELLRLSGIASPAPLRQETRAEELRAIERSPVVRLTAVAVLVVLLLAAGTTLWLNRSALVAEDLADTVGPEGCNGYVELCDRPITEVAFAATHNSQSAADVRGFYFVEQLHGIRSQLDSGIRAFLIKTHYGIETNKGVLTDLSRDTEEQRHELLANLGPDGEAAVERLQASFGQMPKNAESDAYLCHGYCELGAIYMDDALGEIREFLDHHPSEVIILFIGDYVSPTDTADAFVRAGLIDRVYTHKPGTNWPTLRQMIDLNQRVLVLSEHAGDAAKPAWYHDGWAVAQDTPYAFKAPADLQTDDSCAANRGKDSAPLFLINHWVPSQTPSQATAATVNSYDFLLSRVRRCQQLRGLFPNIIAVDFSEKGDLLRVVDTINGVDGDKPSQQTTNLTIEPRSR